MKIGRLAATLTLLVGLGCDEAPIAITPGSADARPADTAPPAPPPITADGPPLPAFDMGAGTDRGPDPAPWLRLDHLQVRGTHNSYHLAPADPLSPAFEFNQPPLAEQLGRQGVRQLEFDVHETGDGAFEVYHVRTVDAESLCPTLRACLAEVEAWSADNPGHHALFVFIEPKSPLRAQPDTLDAAVLDVWPRERIITPSDVRGDHRSLRAALAADGWPSVHQSRGKALFFLFDEGGPRDEYRAANPEPLLFVRHGLHERDDRDGVFYNSDVVQPELFDALTAAGALVRTRGDDPDNRARALDSSAQMISLDDAEALALPGGTPSRCNPRTAPPECAAALIESP